MVSIFKITCVFTIILFMITPTFSQQSYDRTNCSAVEEVPGSNYLCNAQKTECDTYIVYRAQENYNTISSIAQLFHTSSRTLLSLNDISRENSKNLELGKEILVPMSCTCPDRFSHASVLFDTSRSNSSYDVACGAFEGLVKEQILLDQNPGLNVNFPKNDTILVPIRCACPKDSNIKKGTKYLVTYPIIENDRLDVISRKFGVPEDSIFFANGLSTFDTIFPQTTLLIPINKTPVINNLSQVNPAPSPRSVVIDISPGHQSNRRKIAEYIGWVLLGMLLLMIFSFGFFVFIRKRKDPRVFKPLSEASKKFHKSSPELREGVSKLKHSLVIFTPEELKISTEDFSERNVIGESVYKAKIGFTYLAIEQMGTEEGARHVIAILTKINHFNIIKLVGCCYEPTPLLVYEFAPHGSLRDCLANTKRAKQLNWKARVQIAFDLAVGLQYIHHCTKPAYVHRNINSRNVLITQDFRAKISGFRLAKALIWTEKEEEISWNESVIVGEKGYLAPEYLKNGHASTKIDVYAFGVVLIELLCAREVKDDDKKLKDLSFLDGEALGDSTGCLEKFKKFMDPALEGDYQVADAMCLALLAMVCLDEDPLHRPTINDALKALSRFI